jgi:hypothetical protein
MLQVLHVEDERDAEPVGDVDALEAGVDDLPEVRGLSSGSKRSDS